MKGVFLSTVFLITLVSCEPQYPPPEGYVESCYGGDFADNLAGLKPELIVAMEVGVQHWPKLKLQLEELAERAKVDFFYDDRVYGGLTMFNASLCSPKGLFMNVDKRIWKSKEETKVPDLPMMISIYVYHDESIWREFITEAKTEIEKNWSSFFVEFEGDVSLQLSY